jgi:hypothetical protein
MKRVVLALSTVGVLAASGMPVASAIIAAPAGTTMTAVQPAALCPPVPAVGVACGLV